jgi:hypothetical protein
MRYPNPDELKIHIRDASESADMQILSNAWNETIVLTCVESPTELARNPHRWQSELWKFLFMLYKLHYYA